MSDKIIEEVEAAVGNQGSSRRRFMVLSGVAGGGVVFASLGVLGAEGDERGSPHCTGEDFETLTDLPVSQERIAELDEGTRLL